MNIFNLQACKISEFQCKGNEICLPMDKFCDGIDDCGNLSDEPKHCTGISKNRKSCYTFRIKSGWFFISVCNRTYYGDVGQTYAIQVKKPATIPFFCHLTFTASGGSQGDIVQVNFWKQ